MLYTVLVTGSRKYEDYDRILEDIKLEDKIARSLDRTILVVHGGAAGADSLAESACLNLGIHTAKVKARWEVLSKTAGPVRNKVMAEMFEYDTVLAYPLEDSVGTKHMMSIARVKK